MKFINKIYRYIKLQKTSFLLAGVFYATPLFTYAGPAVPAVPLSNPITLNNFADFVEAILDVVLAIGVPVAAIFIIYAGLMFVTAQGNETKLAAAKKAFTWAVIGTAILLGSWVMATAISNVIASL